jgi:hypothetical protein
VGPAGGIYQRTPEQQAAYASQLASIPVNTAVPLPVMPMSIGPSAAMARIQRTGEMTPEQYYSNIRESVSSGQYTPAQLRQMQQGVGASSQDINVAFGRGMTPIGQLQPRSLCRCYPRSIRHNRWWSTQTLVRGHFIDAQGTAGLLTLL